jgi:hypothetical protein
MHAAYYTDLGAAHDVLRLGEQPTPHDTVKRGETMGNVVLDI